MKLLKEVEQQRLLIAQLQRTESEDTARDRRITQDGASRNQQLDEALTSSRADTRTDPSGQANKKDSQSQESRSARDMPTIQSGASKNQQEGDADLTVKPIKPDTSVRHKVQFDGKQLSLQGHVSEDSTNDGASGYQQPGDLTVTPKRSDASADRIGRPNKKEIPVSTTDDDFEARFRRLRLQLLDSLNVMNVQKEEDGAARASRSLPTLTSKQGSEEERLNWTQFPTQNTWRKLVSEDQDSRKSLDQLSTGTLDDTVEGDYLNLGLHIDPDTEERYILDNINQLTLEERMIDEENRKRAAEEQQRKERVFQLRKQQSTLHAKRRHTETIWH